MGELRETKKRETRQRLSDIATAMFYERGFDAVTVEEIAAAANVSKVTVFNYFARKEDLLFDREDEVKHRLHRALSERAKRETPIDALGALVERLAEEKHPFARIDGRTVGFFRLVSASSSLMARLREISDEMVDWLAQELAGPKPDAETRLVAGVIVLTWRTAYGEGIRVFESGGSVKRANAAFRALMDRGFAALPLLAAR